MTNPFHIEGADPQLARRLVLALLMAGAHDRASFSMTTPANETGGGASWFYGTWRGPLPPDDPADDDRDVIDLVALEAPDGTIRRAWHSRVTGLGVVPHAGAC